MMMSRARNLLRALKPFYFNARLGAICNFYTSRASRSPTELAKHKANMEHGTESCAIHEAYMTTIINKSKSLTIPVDVRLVLPASGCTMDDHDRMNCVENLNAKPRKTREERLEVHVIAFVHDYNCQ